MRTAWVLVCVFGLMTIGNEAQGADRLSDRGESCTKTADCKPGLRCIKLECVVPGSKAGIDWVYSEPAGIYFARSETTVAQYRKCVDAGACALKHHQNKSDKEQCNWGHGDRDDHPMNCVSWNGAVQFCAWVKGRLPTWKEWEAEASAGRKWVYPWGKEKPSCSRCVMDDGGEGCGKGHTGAVCTKRRGDSISNLCNMAGNVGEWTGSSTNIKTLRVFCGGYWSLKQGRLGLRASSWDEDDPGHRSSLVGFRCARSSK